MRYTKIPEKIYYDARYKRVIHHTANGGNRIFWNPNMIALLKEKYPTMLNEELAELLGVSQRTMIRKARELELEKDKGWLISIWNERRHWAHIESKKKGYPGTFKKGNMIGKEYRFKKREQPNT